MNLLSAVYIVFLVGMVSCHTTPCTRFYGPWYLTIIHLPPNPNAPVPQWGLGCKWWRPSWSECRGNCGDSSTRLTLNPPPSQYTTDCECCTAGISQLIRPCVWCQWVFPGPFICPVPPPPSGWICGHPNTQYSIVGLCDCRRCNPFGQFIGRKRRDAEGDLGTDPVTRLPQELVDESTIEDMPAPPPPPPRPAVSWNSRRDDYNQYLEQIPEQYRRCDSGQAAPRT